MRGSYYDLLGVAPDAGLDEIRARYHQLMRRYHPDVNRSPLANARAAKINEAFRSLTDAALRAAHDAELAQQRRETVTARAVTLSRSGKRRAGSRRPLWQRYGGRLALASVLAVTILAAWQIQRQLLPAGGIGSPPASTDDRNSEAGRAVAMLHAATEKEAQAMPPVSGLAMAAAMDALQSVGTGADLTDARAFSERCHVEATEVGSWDALDLCVGFDQAVFLRGGRDAGTAGSDYFVDRHDRAASLYVSRISSMDAIGLRLEQIRESVAPAPDERLQARTARVLHRIAKRGWKLAGAARDALDSTEPEQVGAPDNAGGF